MSQRIYCDGVFDLLHGGHLMHFEELASRGTLVVGVNSDADVRKYKRKPVWSEEQRAGVIARLKCVGEVINPCPFAASEAFLKKHNIDAVYHAFGSAAEAERNAGMFYAEAMAMGIFHTLPYNHGTSTTERIKANKWGDIWEKKGTTQHKSDLRLLSGYEDTDFEPESYAHMWKDHVGYAPDESILDVGCGAGYLGSHLPEKNYVGVEQAQSLADVYIGNSRRAILVAGAETLPFKDNSFDHVICHSVLQYLSSKKTAIQAVEELTRVAAKTVFIGDIRTQQHPERAAKHVMEGTISHVVFESSEFASRGFHVERSQWGGPTRLQATLRF